MVWIWSKTKLAAFIKKVTLIELKKYFKHIQKKILEQVKEMVVDECRLQMNARMEAAIAAAANELYEALQKEISPIFTELLARIKGLEEVDATLVEAIEEIAKRINNIEEILQAPEVELPVDAPVDFSKIAFMGVHDPIPPMPHGTDASDGALVRRIARRALGLEG